MTRVAFLLPQVCERGKCRAQFIPSRPAQTTCLRCWEIDHPAAETGPPLRSLLRAADKRRVAHLHAQGLSYRAIAKRLGFSEAKASALLRETRP